MLQTKIKTTFSLAQVKTVFQIEPSFLNRAIHKYLCPFLTYFILWSYPFKMYIYKEFADRKPFLFSYYKFEKKMLQTNQINSSFRATWQIAQTKTDSTRDTHTKMQKKLNMKYNFELLFFNMILFSKVISIPFNENTHLASHSRFTKHLLIRDQFCLLLHMTHFHEITLCSCTRRRPTRARSLLTSWSDISRAAWTTWPPGPRASGRRRPSCLTGDHSKC